ncbi:CRISPR-associated helicase Cas3' [Planktothrix sp. FACHB-1355]|uniref:CRISPR-associated helicase Cas3 n=1 Tax=Aerosakkonema funiforme FACHB-1375 TaxID=2949571 RepID=A0A926VC21_9CYAN|nr:MULTISPECIES: CRISPR-associated helicase Cas3' [Oscillatoriales]MBD2180603.1 CRISPR-associated helicase Cas3' [Aerosakkonema funiforme FACHB-1375]MBD3557637.1 CRISPR-associated helicase Cas3' [Planktothrix sp. FACHB-1355]
MQNYPEWFKEITQNPPFPYQERLATASELPILLNVPTGAGKTAAVVLSWLWRRRYASEEIRKRTPRRLVYCLPMRTLVEQTYTAVEDWLKKVQLSDEIGLHLLMSGAVSDRWEADPEKDCILIGTQDQLLSRALNRGYSMSRYKWPIHFALLNNDCLWVMDEVQLMGAGLRTTAQLQGFREIFGTYGTVRSLWMSATLDPDLLQTVNYKPDSSQVQKLIDDEVLQNETLKLRVQAQKRLVKTKTECSGKENDYALALAKEVMAAHIPGSLTLVICNRVSRAQELYKALEKQTSEKSILIHSRFRAAEREERNQQLQELREKKLSGILVATQAIEAGVDISAQTLFTELAPWSSLVQRFGRCNRYGECSETATVYWIDIPDLKKNASPYKAEQLEKARSLLEELKQVGSKDLDKVKDKYLKEEIEGLIPRQHDLLQLFDTSTDLAGHDIDISSFIRETDENDVAIAWRDWSGEEPPDDMGALQQEELCRVRLVKTNIGYTNDLLDKLKKQDRYPWYWDGLKGKWEKAKAVYPGLSLLLHCSDGGYSEKLGFTGESTDQPEAVGTTTSIESDHDEADSLTYQMKQYVTLVQHSQDVAEGVKQLCTDLLFDNLEVELLERAGRWHDLGKAHAAFQEMLTRDRPERQKEGKIWAKSDHPTKMRLRKYFRHELISALVALQQGEPFLLCYLVAAHHGKVRMTIQPRPNEKAPDCIQRYALGVWEGDCMLPVDLGDGPSSNQELSLACMELGEGKNGESWTARAIALLEKYGPFKLAFLETLIRIADWRASAKYNDEILTRTE